MSTNELAEAAEKLKEYFFSRLFSFHVKYFDQRISRSNFEIASGFCTIFNDVPLFVTCSHFLESLGKKLQDGLIQEVSIGVPRRPKFLSSFELEKADLAAFKYWNQYPCQDFAIGPCGEELQQEMYVGGAKFLQLRPMDSELNCGQYFLFGFSAADSRAKVNDLFFLPSEKGHQMLQDSTMGSFAPRCVPLTNPVLLDDGRLQSELQTEGTASLEGLSGGFVVKIFPGKQIGQYEFVGIQSEQSTLNGKVTSIRYSPSDIIIDCIDHFVRSLNATEQADEIVD